MNIIEKLNLIQTELKAPKNQINNFGGYNYRSCEDILEALKPLLEKTKTALIIADEPNLIGDRFYIKATATLKDCESEAEIKATAYAREPSEKKGMDFAQITGATSSYARKYALNGLFCIDDTKDSDATNMHGNEPTQAKTQKKQFINNDEIAEISSLIETTSTDINNFLAFFKARSLNELDKNAYKQAKEMLLKKLNGAKQ